MAEVPLADIEAKVTLVSRVLPISTAAFEVYEMTHLSDASVEQVATAIQRDASLAAQVLSIANSSFYNPSGEAIYELERAVVRIGQQRIAELALAAGALSAVTAARIPWLNIAALWRQSVAAGVAAELLIKRGGHEGVGKSLLLVATMNSLGRVVLATLYPDRYRKMIRRCKLHGNSLREQEGAIFPENHARIMSRLLSAWNIPEEIHEPLKYTLDSYSSLASLGKPLRTKVEIAKTAVFIGRMAAQSWQPWDLVEIPPLWHLKRLKIDDLSEILQQARPAEAADSSDTGPKDSGLSQGDDSRKNLRLYYHNTGSPAFDSVAELIQPMGIQIVPVEIEDVPPTGKLLVNALFTDSGESARQFRTHGGGETAVLAPTDVSWQPAKSAHVLHEPFSYSALQSLCQRLSTAATEPQPVGA
jgi:HD-like signal output (HDOD) protein